MAFWFFRSELSYHCDLTSNAFLEREKCIILFAPLLDTAKNNTWSLDDGFLSGFKKG